MGFSGGSDSNECVQCRRPGFNPSVGKIPCRRPRQPTPVFLPGESPWAEVTGGLHSPWGCKESDKAERRSTAQHRSEYTQLV